MGNGDKEMTVEIWKDIQGYEGLYRVSSFGNVMSVGNRDMPNGGLRPIKVLRLQEHRDGYLVARLYKDGKQKTHFVHRLVALAFLDNPNKKEQVNHKNGNKKENYVQNLEWNTRSENLSHAYNKRLNKQCSSVNVYEKSSGKSMFFTSLAKASIFMKKNCAYVSARIKSGIMENSKYKWEIING